MKLEVRLESDTVEPGQRIAGHVQVLEGGPSRSLTLMLSFHEATRDYAAVPFSSSVVLHEGDLAAGQALPFELTLPAEAPPSFKAEHSELYWQLEATSDERGFDTSESRRLEVRGD